MDGRWLASALLPDFDVAEEALLDEIIEQDHIVIEASPPDLTSLTALLRHASGVAIGAYIGASAAPAPMLLFVTVPFGMIIMGAAAGIGAALEAGLRTKLLAWLDQPTGEPLQRQAPRRRTPRRDIDL